VIDEIGPMEMTSPAFCRAVLDALEGDAPILGTVVKRSKPFSDAIKARPHVELITVTRANRELLLAPILDRLRAAGLTLTE
jgi:nucleoside-triphosphatase